MGQDTYNRGPRRFINGNRGTDYQPGSHSLRAGGPPKVSADEILESKTLELPRKTLVFSRRQNRNGQFLRIDESHGNHRNSVIIPGENIEDVLAAMEELFPEPAET